MDDTERLAVELDFWDDTVGSFDPIKVVRQLEKSFPDAEVDPTDFQKARLLWELDFWSRSTTDETLREKLIRDSWNLYQRCGPGFRFVVPFPSGHRVSGSARRSSVGFEVPPDLPPECREQSLAFLRSLRLGEPTFESDVT